MGEKEMGTILVVPADVVTGFCGKGDVVWVDGHYGGLPRSTLFSWDAMLCQVAESFHRSFSTGDNLSPVDCLPYQVALSVYSSTFVLFDNPAAGSIPE